jgi:myo-inositol-1(or 4)-monophosphatase
VDITARFAARVIDAVRRVAADEVLPRWRGAAALVKHDGSVVTEADYAAQEALLARLAEIEGVPAIAEEMAAEAQRAVYEAAPRYWCVDPIDGTRNFSAGVPFFAISVALVERGRSLFGVVLDPVADEACHAILGGGAWLDDMPLKVPPRAPPLSRAVAEVSLRRDTARLRAPLKHRAPYAKRLVSGSSALSWCHLAAGRVDVLLHGGQKMWDYAAGALILEEAGGSLCTLEHDDFWAAPAWSRSVIAARSPQLMDEWRTWIRRELGSDSTQRHGNADEHG